MERLLTFPITYLLPPFFSRSAHIRRLVLGPLFSNIEKSPCARIRRVSFRNWKRDKSCQFSDLSRTGLSCWLPRRHICLNVLLDSVGSLDSEWICNIPAFRCCIFFFSSRRTDRKWNVNAAYRANVPEDLSEGEIHSCFRFQEFSFGMCLILSGIDCSRVRINILKSRICWKYNCEFLAFWGSFLGIQDSTLTG